VYTLAANGDELYAGVATDSGAGAVACVRRPGSASPGLKRQPGSLTRSEVNRLEIGAGFPGGMSRVRSPVAPMEGRLSASQGAQDSPYYFLWERRHPRGSLTSRVAEHTRRESVTHGLTDPSKSRGPDHSHAVGNIEARRSAEVHWVSIEHLILTDRTGQQGVAQCG
jgi:hypothetical protein